MTNEQEEWTPPYHEWTLRGINQWNNTKTDDPKEWDNWHGMKVKNLVAALVTYNPNMPICIRDSIGWRGQDNYGIEMRNVIIKANGANDYDQCRDAIRAGTMPYMEVLVLTKEYYNSNSEHIDAYGFEIEEE